MAEIRIQEKKRPIWPWILGLILIGFIAWIVIENMNNFKHGDTVEPIDTSKSDTTSDLYRENQGSDKIVQFGNFVRNSDTIKTIEIAYVKEGLKHLSGAVKEVILESNITDSNITAHSDSLESLTYILRDEEILQTNNVRTVFVSAAQIIDSIDGYNSPETGIDSKDLIKIAKSIDERKSIREQGTKVKRFFSNASEILSSINSKEI